MSSADLAGSSQPWPSQIISQPPPMQLAPPMTPPSNRPARASETATPPATPPMTINTPRTISAQPVGLSVRMRLAEHQLVRVVRVDPDRLHLAGLEVGHRRVGNGLLVRHLVRLPPPPGGRGVEVHDRWGAL